MRFNIVSSQRLDSGTWSFIYWLAFKSCSFIHW